MIWEELNPALVFTNLKAGHSGEVLEQLGSAFIKEGYAKETYVQALIQREQEYPTGLDVYGYGVAIPHTPVEHVNKAGIGIAILENPVTFHVMGGEDDETVDVSIVFMLAVVDPAKHIDELQRILEILQDTAVLARLKKAETPEEIIHLIAEKEKTL